MQAPLFSTITLIAEIIISLIIYYTFYRSYKFNKFPKYLVAFALLYETIFNISYMVSRVGQDETKLLPPVVIAFAAIHGILSLIMFIALIVYMILAYFRGYRKQVNYFMQHKKVTITFLVFWTFSILSGITFYFLTYYIY